MSANEPQAAALTTFRQLVDAIRCVRPEFLRYGGEYSPFRSFHARPDPCPSCGQPTLYCCFSGPLGGGSSITEDYIHVCLNCRHNEFRSKWYGYDGSDWADDFCVMCDFQYGDLRPRAGEWRIRDFGLSGYAPLSMSELQDLLTKNLNQDAAEMIRREIERRGTVTSAPT